MAGRKRKPTHEAKTNVLRICLAPSERELLNRAAAERSLETSTWARAELMMLAKKILSEKK